MAEIRWQRWLLTAALLIPCLVLPLPAHAHPVPKDNHDRTIHVRLTPEGVLVDYTLEIDEWWAAQELPRDRTAGLTTRRDFYAAYAKYLGPVLADRLSGKLDGKALPFVCEKHRFEVLDHVRCDFRFKAAWTLEPGSEHTFSFREGNYELDDFSALRLSLAGNWKLTLKVLEVPDEKLINCLPEQRGPGEYGKLRKASATFVFTPSFTPGEVKAGLPPDPEPVPLPPRRKQRDTLTQIKDPPTGQVAFLRTIPPTEDSDGPPEAKRGLLGLLDTPHGLGFLLLLAAVFGAAHALTPGHGKTLVAAYLVGEQGTVWHAIVLGLSTTLSHTWAVILVAALLALVPGMAGAVQSLLGLVGGLMVAGLGFWLLLRRLARQADHVHLFDGHGHGTPTGKPGWWGVILLGVAGGIVPCLDAVLLLGFAISTQRMWLGLPLLLAFSAGLASVLVLLGVSVVHARNFAISRWGAGERLEQVSRVLPLVSAGVIALMGLWLCFSSIAGVH